MLIIKTIGLIILNIVTIFFSFVNFIIFYTVTEPLDPEVNKTIFNKVYFTICTFILMMFLIFLNREFI